VIVSLEDGETFVWTAIQWQSQGHRATAYWRIEELNELRMLLNQLQRALGYWDSKKA
jgi:hypothetical protein